MVHSSIQLGRKGGGGAKILLGEDQNSQVVKTQRWPFSCSRWTLERATTLEIILHTLYQTNRRDDILPVLRLRSPRVRRIGPSLPCTTLTIGVDEHTLASAFPRKCPSVIPTHIQPTSLSSSPHSLPALSRCLWPTYGSSTSVGTGHVDLAGTSDWTSRALRQPTTRGQEFGKGGGK